MARKKKVEIGTIALVNACDLPDKVLDWCVDREISTHYQSDVAFVPNNDNPFAKWLKAHGYQFKNENDDGDNKGDLIAIIAT